MRAQTRSWSWRRRRLQAAGCAAVWRLRRCWFLPGRKSIWRGLQDIEDILRYIPQNYSTITVGGTYDEKSPRFSQGLVTISLRGLGEGSTLVLVNGNRVSASPTESGSFTDVSTIPFSAIERVEVLTDGASAVYGSDAVGYYPLVELLLEHGMDPAVRNGDGATAAEMVRSQQQRRAALWNGRGMMDTPEQQAALREYNEQSTRLLELLEGTPT